MPSFPCSYRPVLNLYLNGVACGDVFAANPYSVDWCHKYGMLYRSDQSVPFRQTDLS